MYIRDGVDQSNLALRQAFCDHQRRELQSLKSKLWDDSALYSNNMALQTSSMHQNGPSHQSRSSSSVSHMWLSPFSTKATGAPMSRILLPRPWTPFAKA